MSEKKIRTLRFVVSRDRGKPTRIDIDCSSEETLRRSVEDRSPAVYVVPAKSIGILRAVEGFFSPVRKKNPNLGLSRYLKRADRIPLVEGSYRSAPQLRRGVYDYLGKARGKNHADMAFLAVPEEVFASLWEDAEYDHSPASLTGAIPEEYIRDADGDSPLTTEEVLRFLSPEEIPEELRKSYVGASPDAELVRVLILRAARFTETPVLITGETGTGKEIVARSIHTLSNGLEKDFMPINCSAVPADLLESELFGHEPGAFTDARGLKVGLFEAAGKGTVFLDEIGDLPPAQQPKLLRVIEEREFRRVGSTRPIKFQARIIAATNRNLSSMVESGTFREDLYYRLCQFAIPTPSIQAHREDIPVIVRAAWARITEGKAPPLPPKIVNEFSRHSWPGNVRQIKATLTALHGLFGARDLKMGHLRVALHLMGGPGAAPAGSSRGTDPMADRAQCLRHLSKACETVRACKIMMRELPKALREGGEALELLIEKTRWHLGRIDLLCNAPHLFHSAEAFRSVYLLKRRLYYFGQFLAKDAKTARRYYRAEMKGQFEAATEALVSETGRIVDRI